MSLYHKTISRCFLNVFNQFLKYALGAFFVLYPAIKVFSNEDSSCQPAAISKLQPLSSVPSSRLPLSPLLPTSSPNLPISCHIVWLSFFFYGLCRLSICRCCSQLAINNPRFLSFFQPSLIGHLHPQSPPNWLIFSLGLFSF